MASTTPSGVKGQTPSPAGTNLKQQDSRRLLIPADSSSSSRFSSETSSQETDSRSSGSLSGSPDESGRNSSCTRCQQQPVASSVSLEANLKAELEAIKAEMKKANMTINALQEREKQMKARYALCLKGWNFPFQNMNSFCCRFQLNRWFIHEKTGCLWFHDELILFKKLEHICRESCFTLLQKVWVVVDSCLVVLEKWLGFLFRDWHIGWTTWFSFPSYVQHTGWLLKRKKWPSSRRPRHHLNRGPRWSEATGICTLNRGLKR